MYRIAVVEDDIAERAELISFIKQYQKEKNCIFDIKEFGDGIDFVAFLDKGNQFDIIFMDIRMPYMNGLKASRILREKDDKACLIFITIMAQYAVKGYEYDAIDYIVKPVRYPHLSVSLEKAINRSNNHEHFYSVPDGDGGLVRIDFSKIYYIRSENHYCYFYTSLGVFKKNVSISTLEKEFANAGYVRSNVSFIINPMWITRLSKNDIYINDIAIPISKRRRKALMGGIQDYVLSKK